MGQGSCLHVKDMAGLVTEEGYGLMMGIFYLDNLVDTHILWQICSFRKHFFGTQML